MQTFANLTPALNNYSKGISEIHCFWSQQPGPESLLSWGTYFFTILPRCKWLLRNNSGEWDRSCLSLQWPLQFKRYHREGPVIPQLSPLLTKAKTGNRSDSLFPFWPQLIFLFFLPNSKCPSIICPHLFYRVETACHILAVKSGSERLLVPDYRFRIGPQTSSELYFRNLYL